MGRVSAIQAEALAVKVTPHFGQRTCVELMRRSSAGGISYPQLEHGGASDAFTSSRLTFWRAGIGDSIAEQELTACHSSEIMHTQT
jgi:hypothetical protein